MNTVYLLLGSNLGNSEELLATAIEEIVEKIGYLKKYSSLYRTAAWGNENQPDFLNQIIVVASSLSAAAILKDILNIETDMGRIRTIKNAARVIDIDILFFNDEVIHTKDLTIPHPQIENRRFVLVPLDEVTPFYQHPSLKKTAKELLLICPDKLNVQNI